MRITARAVGIWEDGGGVIEDAVGGAGEENLARSGWVGVRAKGIFEGPGELEGSDIEARRFWGVVGCDGSLAGTREA